MAGRRLGGACSVLLAVVLAGCSGPLGLYHRLEGGAIARHRQPPPGANLPYPNLASVPPAAPAGASQSAIDQQVRSTAPGVSAASPGALAGLALPGAAPALPNIPGLNLPATPATPAPPPVPKAISAPVPQNSAPVAFAFPAGSAVLPQRDLAALHGLAAAQGNARLLVGGFGDSSSLRLALARAQRLADALTALGVPPASIRLVAARAGSGGFVQFVY